MSFPLIRKCDPRLLSLKHVYQGGMGPEPLLQAVLSGLRDGSPFEEQVIRYMLEMYPLITIDLLVRVIHRDQAAPGEGHGIARRTGMAEAGQG